MSDVGAWVLRFLSSHKKRYRPHDWPTAEDAEEFREFVAMWATAFQKKGVTEKEAEKASRALGPTPPNWRREHLEMVMSKIQQHRAEAGSVEGMEQKTAREASADCVHCGGNGLAMAWSASPSSAKQRSETVPAHCVCSHGRWQRHAYALQYPNGFRGILDYQDVLDGKARGWLSHPPGHPELAVGSKLERPGRLRWREYAGLFRVP